MENTTVFTLTKEDIQQIAKNHPETKAVLEKLFPKAFDVWKRMGYFDPIHKDGRRCLEHSVHTLADIWIDDAFELIPLEEQPTGAGGIYYRLELK